MNKRSGRKKTNKEDLKRQLGEELTDVIHYTLAIGALNGLDMNQIILEKDKAASIEHDHKINLEQFVINNRNKKTDL